MNDSIGRTPLPYKPDCAGCEFSRRNEEDANQEHNWSRAVDARVLGRRHLRVVHDVVTMHW